MNYLACLNFIGTMFAIGLLGIVIDKLEERHEQED